LRASKLTGSQAADLMEEVREAEVAAKFRECTMFKRPWAELVDVYKELVELGHKELIPFLTRLKATVRYCNDAYAEGKTKVFLRHAYPARELASPGGWSMKDPRMGNLVEELLIMKDDQGADEDDGDEELSISICKVEARDVEEARVPPKFKKTLLIFIETCTDLLCGNYFHTFVEEFGKAQGEEIITCRRSFLEYLIMYQDHANELLASSHPDIDAFTIIALKLHKSFRGLFDPQAGCLISVGREDMAFLLTQIQIGVQYLKDCEEIKIGRSLVRMLGRNDNLKKLVSEFKIVMSAESNRATEILEARDSVEELTRQCKLSEECYRGQLQGVSPEDGFKEMVGFFNNVSTALPEWTVDVVKELMPALRKGALGLLNKAMSSLVHAVLSLSSKEDVALKLGDSFDVGAFMKHAIDFAFSAGDSQLHQVLNDANLQMKAQNADMDWTNALLLDLDVIEKMETLEEAYNQVKDVPERAPDQVVGLKVAQAACRTVLAVRMAGDANQNPEAHRLIARAKALLLLFMKEKSLVPQDGKTIGGDATLMQAQKELSQFCIALGKARLVLSDRKSAMIRPAHNALLASRRTWVECCGNCTAVTWLSDDMKDCFCSLKEFSATIEADTQKELTDYASTLAKQHTTIVTKKVREAMANLVLVAKHDTGKWNADLAIDAHPSDVKTLFALALGEPNFDGESVDRASRVLQQVVSSLARSLARAHAGRGGDRVRG
jgi:hypothetical protein